MPDTERVSTLTACKAILLPGDEGSYYPQFSTAELKKASRELEAHFINSRSPVDIVDSEPVYFENKIVYAIRDWSAAVAPQLLRIGGPSETRYPSTTSEISAIVAKTAFDLNLPALYLVCGCLTKGKEPIISILYSLIYQLINHINVPHNSLNFSVAQLQELDGTLETCDKAISTFSDLLSYTPSTLLIIIDGIERLDREGTEVYIDALVNLLQDQVARQDLCPRSGKVLKVLFTTAGPCASLNKLDDKVRG